MSRKVKGPDGVVRIFPDDASDEEIGAALEAAAPAQPRTLGPNTTGEARIGADPRPGGADYRVLGVPIHVPGPDRPRADENMADVGGVGIPPETVLMGPLQAGRAMLRPGLSMAGRALSGAGELATAAAPIVKYEIAKHALMHYAKMPEGVASVAAAAISGYRSGGAKGAAETVAKDAPVVAETAAAASPVPSRPVPAAAAREPIITPPPAKPTGPPASPQFTASREVFAKAGVEPLTAEISNVATLIQRGKAPEEALRIVVGARPTAQAAAPVAETAAKVAPVAEKLTLTADEYRVFNGLIQKGKTPTQARDAILAQRDLLAKMGGGAMTDSAAQAALDAKNARGGLKSPSAQTAEARRTR